MAMDKEFAELRTLLDTPREESCHHKTFVIGRIEDNEIIMQQCGIGKVNSAIGAVEMINLYHPDLIISTGCAGGADVWLNPLDVVVASSCVYHDAYCGDNVAYGQVMGMPERYDAPHELVDRALSVTMPEGQQIKAGLTVSGDWFVDSREKMREVLGHFPEAEAVDMESCSIAQTCYVYGIPFISFRIISDVPLKDTNAAQYFDFWDRMAEGSFEVTRNFLQTLTMGEAERKNNEACFNHPLEDSETDISNYTNMNKIPSFTINHEKLLRGIYVSRKDEVGGETVTTFDIRMKEPNREPVVHPGALHTIEHLAATFLRNDEEWKDRVIYWGPMGCLTGSYLLLRGDLEPKDIVGLMRRTFAFIANFEGDIPGAAPRDCGNYLLHDLPMARWEAKKFLTEVLENIKEENMVYPG